jgi:methylated-DNA-protein-cysteine methyltransferase-like protein
MVSRIPEGTVATYGQIAECVGVGPRQVGRALAEMRGGIACPWHRVINARGEVSPRSRSKTAHLKQRRLLEREGIVFRNGRVDLEVYRWHPEM